MELRQLEVFLAIAEELHFGRAAARLHLAQPSLSQQLSRLERELGVRLVARTSHQVRLTAAGQAFRPEASRVVDAADRARRTAIAAGAGQIGQVRVGFNYPAGRRILPSTLSRLRERHPGISTSLRESRTGPQLDALDANELDVGFVYGPPDRAALASRPVMRASLAALVSVEHPLGDRDEVSFAELASHPCVLFRREQSPAMYDTLMTAAGGRLTIAEMVDDSAATGVVIASGQYVGFASMVRADYAPLNGMKVLRLVEPTPTVDIHVVWFAENDEPAVNTFLDSVNVM